MTRPTHAAGPVELWAYIREIEDELDAWRRNARDDFQDAARSLEVYRVGRLLRQYVGTGWGIPGIARLLIYLIAHAVRLCRHAELHAAISLTDETGPKIVNVRVCQLRRALRGLGCPGAIQNVPRLGYAFDRLAAKELAELLGLAHD